MPELPEVETIARALALKLRGRRIVSAEFRCLRVLRGDPDTTAAGMAGRNVRAVRRHGKFIEIDPHKMFARFLKKKRSDAT